jgi:hypothetical protein
MNKKFNVKRMVEDLGGVIAISRYAETHRTAPYRWIRTGGMSIRTLERIKSNCRHTINIDSYFEDAQ